MKTSLLSHEFAKHTTRFNIALAILILLLHTGIAAYRIGDCFSSDADIIRAEKLRLIAIYESEPDEYARLIDEHNRRVGEYESQMMRMSLDGSFLMPEFENRYIDLPSYGDRKLFSEVEAIVNSYPEFQRSVNELLHESSIRLLDTDDTDSYNYKYYVKLLNKYSAVSDVAWEVTPIFGWNEFFSIDTSPIFLLFISAGLFYGTFSFEKSHKISNIISLTRRGTSTLTCVKLIYVALTAVAFTVAFTLIQLLLPAISCGLGGGGLPIQALDGFSLCPYRITIVQYFFIYLAVRILFVVMISLLFALINRLSESELFTLAAAIASFAASFISDAISVDSAFGILKRFNWLTLANVNIMFETFGTLNFFNHCVEFTPFVIGLGLAVCIICVTVVMLWRESTVTVEVRGGGNRLSKPVYSIRQSESFKLFVTNRAAFAIVAVVLLKVIISYATFSTGYVGMEALYRDYVLEVEGAITDDTLAIIDAESEYISTNIAIYGEMKSAYASGELTQDEYNAYLGRYNYANFCHNAHSKLCDRRDYLLSLDKSHDGIEFVYDEGLDRLFASTIDLPALLIVMFVSSVIFTHEYSSGFVKILRLTKFGRAKIFVCKYALALLLSTVAFAVFTAIDLAMVSRYGGMPNLAANVMSMPRFADVGGDFSILEYLILYKCVGFIGYVTFALLVASVSILFESMIKTMLISGIAVFLPFITDYFGIGLLGVVNLNRFILPEDILGGLVTYAIFTLAAVALLSAAHRKWVGRRYR